jgi:hypothetical protein
MVSTLISHGADALARDNRRLDALSVTALSNNAALLEVMITGLHTCDWTLNVVKHVCKTAKRVIKFQKVTMFFLV